MASASAWNGMPLGVLVLAMSAAASEAMMDFPPSAEIRLRMRSWTKESCSFLKRMLADGAAASGSAGLGVSTLSRAVGEKRSACPVCRPTMVLKRSASWLEELRVVDLAPARWRLIVSNHAGDRKR